MEAVIQQEENGAEVNHETQVQYSTFYVAGRLYGIDVRRVQEVTKALPMTPVPLSQTFVLGLINLRGQISTAIGLRELFQITGDHPDETMNVVCRIEGVLVSLVVDEIGDVLELERKDFEEAPSTVSENLRRFMSGVYKMPNELLSVIDIDKVMTILNSTENHEFDNQKEETDYGNR